MVCFYRFCCWYSINIPTEWNPHGYTGLAICFLYDWMSDTYLVCILVVPDLWLTCTTSTDLKCWTEILGTCYWSLCCFSQGVVRNSERKSNISFTQQLTSVERSLDLILPMGASHWLTVINSKVFYFMNKPKHMVCIEKKKLGTQSYGKKQLIS